MSYLLDVNALIAIGYKKHEFHQRVALWARGKNLLTCSISEIGFVRVLSGLREADVTTSLCRQLLAQMKADWKMQLLPDHSALLKLYPIGCGVRDKLRMDTFSI